MNAITDYMAGFRTPSRTPTRTTALYGRPLVYLPGVVGSAVMSHPGAVVEPPLGQDVYGESTFKIAYCNLINCEVEGGDWLRNLITQFATAKSLGFDFVELDNADTYGIEHVLSAVKVAEDYRLKVIAKNPRLVDHGNGAAEFVGHPNVWGMIVERGAGTPAQMNTLRADALKDGIIPVWFVFEGSVGANQCAEQVRQGGFRGMGVTYSTGRGLTKYKDSISVLTPIP